MWVAYIGFALLGIWVAVIGIMVGLRTIFKRYRRCTPALFTMKPRRVEWRFKIANLVSIGFLALSIIVLIVGDAILGTQNSRFEEQLGLEDSWNVVSILAVHLLVALTILFGLVSIALCVLSSKVQEPNWSRTLVHFRVAKQFCYMVFGFAPIACTITLGYNYKCFREISYSSHVDNKLVAKHTVGVVCLVVGAGIMWLVTLALFLLHSLGPTTHSLGKLSAYNIKMEEREERAKIEKRERSNVLKRKTKAAISQEPQERVVFVETNAHHSDSSEQSSHSPSSVERLSKSCSRSAHSVSSCVVSSSSIEPNTDTNKMTVQELGGGSTARKVSNNYTDHSIQITNFNNDVENESGSNIESDNHRHTYSISDPSSSSKQIQVYRDTTIGTDPEVGASIVIQFV